MSEKEYQYIKLERKGKIMILHLNRPEKKNAMNLAMRAEIIDALESLKDEKRSKCIIIYGGEDFFSAGFDRDEVQSVVQGEVDPEEFIQSNHDFHQEIFEYPKLLIAAINGFALAGAFDLAVICHLRIASEGSLFGHPEIRFGACPLFFPYMMLVGRGKALELTLNTASKETFITAEEAHHLNLINNVVKKGTVLEEALNMAKQIIKSPEYAIAQLIQVNNLFLDQVKTFDAEINKLVESMRNIIEK